VRRLLLEEAAFERVSPRVAGSIFVLPFAATLGLAVAALHPPLFRALVVEDGPLEWAGVLAFAGAFGVAAVLAVTLARAGRRAQATAALALSAGCLFVVGEEVSWGQRLGGWETPGALRNANVQEETTLHNVSGVDEAFRVALLLAGLYGSCAWLAARRRPRRAGQLVLAPPLFLASLFVVPLAYYGVRLTLFPSPSYGVAKFSELPELLVASGLLAVLVLSWRRLRAAPLTPRRPGRPRRGALREPRAPRRRVLRRRPLPTARPAR
jgi:hypothetical protein